MLAKAVCSLDFFADLSEIRKMILGRNPASKTHDEKGYESD